jgi:hypothetical protein
VDTHFNKKKVIYFPFKVKNSDMPEEGKELITIQPYPPFPGRF